MTAPNPPRNSTAPVGIRQVADLAGVSPGTVSNTLNRPERVAPSTRAAVHQAIAQLGFVPNQQARMLTGVPSRLIGLMVLDLTSPFFMQLAQSVEATCRASGYAMLLCNSENDRDREAEFLNVLTAHRVHGAIITPAHGSDPERNLMHAQVPMVLLDHDGPGNGCGVAVDHVAGARAATKHLIELGHLSFAFVAGPSDLRQFVQRAQGIKAELSSAGIDPETHLTEVYTEDDMGMAAGDQAAQLLLKDQMPTAVLCGNDMLAFGMYRALRKAGLRIPQDVSLVGYDDVEFAANWTVPLTSVRQPTIEMGKTAANLLIEHAKGSPSHSHQQVLLQPELVVRDSTAQASGLISIRQPVSRAASRAF